MSRLYKYTGITEQIDDNPENPLQPHPPGRIIPRSYGNPINPITGLPVGSIQVGCDTLPPQPGGASGPSGPGGNYILLSRWARSGGGKLPPGTTIINDL